MPFKDPEKRNKYMRERRAKSKQDNKVNVNPERKPVIPKGKSQVSGTYEDELWVGICPSCNFLNKMDPRRSYRPVERCDHFQQLRNPGQPSEFIFKRGVTQKNVNPLTRDVNPEREKFLLSYSRNKYQFVLYSVDSSGRKSLIRSCRKNDVLKLGPCEVELTWGPEEEKE